MIKPTLKHGEPYWDYHEVINYLLLRHPLYFNERKVWQHYYNSGFISFISNGFFFNIDTREKDITNKDIQHFFTLLEAEFYTTKFHFWVEW